MHELLHDPDQTRPRDPAQERRERHRYWLLKGIHEQSRDDRELPVSAVEIGEAMGLPREETFRLVHFLAHHGYLHYVGAGPRVRITEKGVHYLRHDAGRRRSIRDA